MKKLIDRTIRATLGALVLLMIAGCTVGPEYAPPQTEMPDQWGELSGEVDAQATTDMDHTPTNESVSLAEWWLAFDDPMLNSLVERAVHANLDLRAATARVRESRAQRGVVAADLYPAVDATASYSRSRNSDDSFPTSPGASAGEEADLYRAGFDATWEIDIFGGVRRSVEAADADIAVSIEDYRDVLVTLLAEIARNYVELRGSQQRIEIARANLESQRETLEITRARLEAGLISDFDVARAEAQVQLTESQIPSLQNAARQSIHALSVLLAMEPTALVDELSTNRAIPTGPPRVPVGLPSDLLRRRPDVRRAERQLAAATARIGVATADLFPRFSLTGSIGLESSHMSSLGNFSSRFWSIGPSVRWPILDFGRLRSNVDVQNAREQQAFAAYQQIVLNSLREVEDALVTLSTEQAREQRLASAVQSNQRAVELARQLYQHGLSDFISVLQAERDLYESEDALVQSRRTVTTSLVSLYKALGGGWDTQAIIDVEDADANGTAGSRRLQLSQG